MLILLSITAKVLILLGMSVILLGTLKNTKKSVLILFNITSKVLILLSITAKVLILLGISVDLTWHPKKRQKMGVDLT